MEKIKIVKGGVTRSIDPKHASKWSERGYKRVETATPKETVKAKAKQ